MNFRLSLVAALGAMLLVLSAVSVNAACSAASHQSVYNSTLFGTILSDVDGYDSTVSYSNNEDCTWTVECPTSGNRRFAIRDLDYDGEPAFDALTINPVGGTTGSAVRYASPPHLNEYRNTTWTSAAIRFTSDGSRTGRGFTLRWECLEGITVAASNSPSIIPPMPTIQACSAPRQGVWTEQSGVWYSDPDGAGTSLYGVAETCGYEVRCPYDHYFVVDSLQLNSEDTFDVLRLYSVDRGTLIEAFSGTNQRRVAFNPWTQHMRAQWTTDATVTGAGWTLQWSCKTANEYFDSIASGAHVGSPSTAIVSLLLTIAVFILV